MFVQTAVAIPTAIDLRYQFRHPAKCPDATAPEREAEFRHFLWYSRLYGASQKKVESRIGRAALATRPTVADR